MKTSEPRKTKYFNNITVNGHTGKLKFQVNVFKCDLNKQIFVSFLSIPDNAGFYIENN